MKNIRLSRILKGTAFSMVITFIAVLILGIVTSIKELPANVMNIIILACLGLGVLLSSIIVTKNTDSLSALHALLVGVFVFFVLFIVSVIVNGSAVFNTHILTLLLICILCAFLGAVLGNQSSSSF